VSEPKKPKSAPKSLKAIADALAAAPKKPDNKLSSQARRARTVARLAAVQALYQMELAGAGVDDVVKEFIDHRFDGDLEGEALAAADEAYFEAIVRGVVTQQAKLDGTIAGRLADGWRLERLDSTLRAILRAGAYELAYRPDVPLEIVIDEYVELAKAFADPAEAKFVNAALDGVARDFRT
jgi:N utilization substance protein B